VANRTANSANAHASPRSDDRPSILCPPPPWDTRLLFITRAVRLFAYGSISLILVLYLVALGYRGDRIGVLLTMTPPGRYPALASRHDSR
jgi:hypothetical protein